MNKPKVLLIQDVITSYRDPIYALINRQVDLTVGYTTFSEVEEPTYRIVFMPFKKIGRVIWHNEFRKTINQYDAVVFMPYLKMMRLVVLPFLPHKPKLISWSIGVYASYTRPYNLKKKPDFLDKLFETIQDHADACVFYTREPIEYWRKYRKIDEKKYFVAHNTVAVAPLEKVEFAVRNLILFVGTLYKQKGIGELLSCYAKAKEKTKCLPQLIIVGKGPEKDAIEAQINLLHIENDVELTGPIYDEEILKNYFAKAIVCISPKQAGLTVLKSLGYGVPFVTRTDAITGGEKVNIISGETGLFYDSEEELIEIISKTATERQFFSAMSESALRYYRTKASPELMAQGVVDAIRYSLRNR